MTKPTQLSYLIVAEVRSPAVVPWRGEGSAFLLEAFLLEALEEKPFPCLPQLLEASRSPRLVAPSSILKAGNDAELGPKPGRVLRF